MVDSLWLTICGLTSQGTALAKVDLAPSRPLDDRACNAETTVYVVQLHETEE